MKKPSPKTAPDTVAAHSAAEEIMRSLRVAMRQASGIEAEFNQALESIKQQYQTRIDAAKKTVADLESSLEALAKRNKTALFAGPDTRIDLTNGALIYTIEKRVKRIRDMLARVEAAGRVELVKIAKSVDWDSVEKLPDAELAALGTLRQQKDRFTYELKG